MDAEEYQGLLLELNRLRNACGILASGVQHLERPQIAKSLRRAEQNLAGAASSLRALADGDQSGHRLR